MLTHEDIHYIAGFLEVIARGAEAEGHLGKMLYDEEAEIHRDVDIVIMNGLNKDGEAICMTGIEVKDHKRPLDIGHVEQLIAKLESITGVTEKCIVSSSGYTESAATKAKKRGIKLLDIKDHDGGHGFGLALPANGKIFQREVTFSWSKLDILFNCIENIPKENRKELNVETPIFLSNGSSDRDFKKIGDLNNWIKWVVEMRLKQIGHIRVGETKDTKMRIPLRTREGKLFYLKVDDKFYPIDSAFVDGIFTRNERIQDKVAGFKVITDHFTGIPYVGAILLENYNKDLMAIAFSEHDRGVRVFGIRSIDRNKKKIRDYKVSSVGLDFSKKI